jgi:hypothetical protein
MDHDNHAKRMQACAELRRAAEALERLPLEDPKRALEALAATLDDLGRWSERAGLDAATGEDG